MDADARRLMLFAGSIGSVLGLLIAASAVINRHSGYAGPVPVVLADPSPIRVKPDDPGGMKIDAADSEVFAGRFDGSSARLAPPSETYNPSALKAAEADAAKRSAAAGTRPAAVSGTVPSANGASGVGSPGVGSPGINPPSIVPAAIVPAGVVASALVPPGVVPPVVVQPGVVPSAGVPPVVVQPLPANGRQSAPVGSAQPASRRGEEAVPASARPVTPPSQPATPGIAGSQASASGDNRAAAGGHVLVQLAAVASEADATFEWKRLSKRFPDLFNGHAPAISKTEHDGRVFWRVRADGFADVAGARDFCGRLRAKNTGCTVTEF